MDKVFSSWSGGKDSCLACYKAGVSGMQVCYLLNMVTEDGERSWSHQMAGKWLEMQSRAVGIPIIQQRTSSANYEAEFKNAIRAMRKDGISGGIFGDIDFNAHREWIDRVCGDAGVVAHLPLWGRSQDEIMREFVDLGFVSIVVATKAELLGEEWVGRKVDRDFIGDLEKLSETRKVTPCGEAGEYHTIVVDGPLFKQRLEIVEARKVQKGEHWFLEIQKCELRPK